MNINDQMLRELTSRSLFIVKSYKRYYVNGYKFHIVGYRTKQNISNSRICIKRYSRTINAIKYFSHLTNILEVEYPALLIKKIVLFK